VPDPEDEEEDRDDVDRRDPDDREDLLLDDLRGGIARFYPFGTRNSSSAFCA
jgi:hypothetical protein